MYHIKQILSLRTRLTIAAGLLAVLQAAVQCYAVEGSYPASLDYLEENYGLLVNHDRFIVTYEAFASNLMPQVNVLERA